MKKPIIDLEKELEKVGVFKMDNFDARKYFQLGPKDEIPSRLDRAQGCKKMLSRIKKCECGELGLDRYLRTNLQEGSLDLLDYTICLVMCEKCYKSYRSDN
jgi:hypothetical protein